MQNETRQNVNSPGKRPFSRGFIAAIHCRFWKRHLIFILKRKSD